MPTPSEAFAAEIAAANATDEIPDNTEVEAPVVADAPAPTETPVVAVAEVAAPPAPRTLGNDDLVEVDYLTPDDPRLPPTRRKVRFQTLAEDRNTAIKQSIDAGNAKNAAEARAAVLEKTVEVLTRRFGEPPPAPATEPPPPETSADALRRRVDPATLPYDPEGVLTAAVDVADERAQGHMSEVEKKLAAALDAKSAALDQRIAAIEQERATLRTTNAYRAAFPGRDPMTDPDLDDITFFIEAANNAAVANGQAPPLPTDDPNSYRTAAARLDAIAARRAPPPPPTPTPVTTVAVPPQATPAPAPPVGSGAPAAAAPPSDISALPQHERVALQDMVNIFPQLRGKTEILDEITNEVAADSAAGRSPYSRRNMKRSATV